LSDGEGFWDFSLRVYAREGVAGACLTLQEQLQVDVNLLLYCCWLGHSGTVLDSARLARALAFSQPWAQQVVRPLRGARRWMKAQPDSAKHDADTEYQSLRDAIKRVELQAERFQQHALAALTAASDTPAPPVERRLELMASNLKNYLGAAEIEIDTQVGNLLTTLLVAASDSDPAAARDKLRRSAGAAMEPTRD